MTTANDPQGNTPSAPSPPARPAIMPDAGYGLTSKWAPDIAVQIEQPQSPTISNAILQRITSALALFLNPQNKPGPFVDQRSYPAPAPGADPTVPVATLFAVWFTIVDKSSTESAQRDEWLATVGKSFAISGKKPFAFYFSLASLSTLTAIAFAAQKKDYSFSKGDLHLSSASVAFNPAKNQLITSIAADLAPLGITKINFTATIAETLVNVPHPYASLELIPGNVLNVTVAKNTNFSTKDLVEAGFIGGFTTAGLELGVFVFGTESELPGQLPLGPLSQLVPKLPAYILSGMVPSGNGGIYFFNYDPPVVQDLYMVLSGLTLDSARPTPTAGIRGPTTLNITEGEGFDALYSVTATWLEDGFTAKWSTSGTEKLGAGEYNASTYAALEIPAPTAAEVGTSSSRTISVVCTDSDGFTATASIDLKTTVVLKPIVLPPGTPQPSKPGAPKEPIGQK